MEYVVLGIIFGLFLSVLPENPHSTVILLPDDDGKVGEVFVTNKADTQTIRTAYTAVQVEGNEAKMSIASVPQEQIREQFQSTLSAQPDKVTNYILYFKSGSSQLTAASQAELPQIIADIRSRQVYEAYVVGHTDTVGTFDQNHRLGLKRAKLLKTIIEKNFPDSNNIQASSHGEGNLLIPTADNIDESKNRRVEIEIH